MGKMNLKKAYVRNMTHLWAHVMKRSVGPGKKVYLDKLYEQYGAKHNLEPTEEFIVWLRDVKLRDQNKWQIFLDESTPFGGVSINQEVREEPKASGSITVKVDKSRGENVAPPVVKDMEVADIVSLTVRAAREIVPIIQDIKLLKYAVQEANQLPDKDSLVRMLRKRIQELSIGARR